MICPRCKKELSEDSIFCNYCGRKLSKNKRWNEISSAALGVLSLFLFFIILIDGFYFDFEMDYDFLSDTASTWMILISMILSIISLILSIRGILRSDYTKTLHLIGILSSAPISFISIFLIFTVMDIIKDNLFSVITFFIT